MGTNLSTVVSNVIRGGTYEVTVEAINSAGSPVTDYEIATYTIPQTGTIDSIHLLAVDYPPTIALTTPTNGAKYTAPASIQITAQAADDEAVQFVDVFSGTNLIRRISTAPYYVNWTNVPAGQYEVYAIAVDTFDQFTRSGSSMVTVETAQPPPPSLPAGPTSLTAKFNNKNGRVRLDWVDNATNEVSYVVERSLNGTSFAAIKTLAANKISFADATVQRGVRYYYRIRVVNAAGSRVSSTVSILTPL